MRILVGVAGALLLFLVLRDAFETIVLPRRVRRPFGLTTLFYRVTWRTWSALTSRAGGARELALSWFGPLSLLLLLVLWAAGIILAFGALHWAAGSALVMPGHTPGFLDDLYLSGTTFFTLGLGDVVPRVTLAKVFTVTEAGTGFAFLAVTIGYLPVIYQAFSRREIGISLLDARAGSPPAAGELLRRNPPAESPAELIRLLGEWERWAAELLESHLSYPVLAYFRSQHGNQSWLATLTVVLDTSAVVAVGCDSSCARQAELTFAMARHAAVDLAQVFSAPRPEALSDRLTELDYALLVERLGPARSRLESGEARDRFIALRLMYEPYVAALSDHLLLALPGWSRQSDKPDNWEAAPWKNTAETSEHF